MLFAVPCYAQDIVYFENGDSVRAQVYKVQPGKIEYLEKDNPELSTHKRKVKDITHINFQDENRRPLNKDVATSYMSLNFATNAIPVGRFAALDGGHAGIGFSPSIQAGFFFKNNLGVAINLGGYYNELDPNHIERLGEGISNEPTDYEYIDLDVGEWKGGYFFTGLVYSLKFKNLHRFTFDIRLLGGLMSAEPPGYSYEYNHPAPERTTIYNTDISTTTAPALNAGLNVRYDLTKNFAINLIVQFIGANSKVEFTDVEIYDDFGGGGYSEQYTKVSYNQPVTFINSGIGITYDFARKKHK